MLWSVMVMLDYTCTWFMDTGVSAHCVFNICLSDSTESVALKLYPYACCDINLTANDSIGKTAMFFGGFLPARPPALKRLKAARQQGEQSSSKAPSLRDSWAVLRASKLLQVSCASI